MKVVVLDGATLNPGDNPWDPVAALGTLEVHDFTPRDRVIERARGADVVVTNKTRLDATALAELPQLRLIAVLATGYDNVDVAAAAAHGVAVCNVPAYATDSVAQHAFALLFELCRRTSDHAAAVRAGEWARRREFSFWLTAPVELTGLTMGIVGFGAIGRRTAELARAFGMDVIAAVRPESVGRPPSGRSTSPCSTDDARPRPRASAETPPSVPLVELFARADVVSLHCPLTPATERIVNAASLARMKATAFLLNTARGRLVDEDALAAALRAGTIAGAGLDTLSREPPPDDHPLLAAPNCIVTPHMAWASLVARRRLMSATAENIRAFFARRPINVVSPGPKS